MDAVHALIVDDDHDTANLFKTVLTLVGFKCDVAYTAKAALAYLASNEPDIVLLDMRLGLEIDGGDILYQIRANPRFDKMRVIVITAYPGMLSQVSNLADLTMLKPIEIDDLETLAARITQVKPKSFLFRDRTTNLYNLSFFTTRLEHAYERARRFPDLVFMVVAIQFAPLFLADQEFDSDLTGILMKEAAARLNKDFRPTDTFGYLGETRVVALYEDLKQPTDIYIIVKRMQDIFQDPIEIENLSITLTPTFGAVRVDPKTGPADSFVARAVEALESACRYGQPYLVVEQ